MKPSPQQEAFLKEMGSPTTRNIVLKAGAGTGKTTTMVMGVQATDPSQRVVCTAFNKSIAVALEQKMPDNALCKTFHALGLAAWTAATGTRPQVDGKKTWIIAKEMKLPFGSFPDLGRALGLAKNFGLVVGDSTCEKGMVPDTRDFWRDLFEDFDLDTGDTEDPIDVCRGALAASDKMSWQGVIDFDDMIRMPALFGGPLPLCDVVVVDEVQDVNNIQVRMIEKMAVKGRLIAVGDPYQAIYAFRGADSSAFQRIIKHFDAKVLPLSVSYRCPKSVVAEAQQYVREFESHPDAIQGEVERLKTWTAEDLGPRDAILCRNNKPIIELAFHLISQGVGCHVKGKEIGEGLVKLIKKMKATEMNVLYGKLEDYMIAEKNKLIARGKEAQADNLGDKVASVLCLMDRLPESATINELTRTIDRMFDPKRGLLTLSTIHKAKGLEWKHIYFLDSWLLPSKFAKSQAARQQEDNLSYVGITRAMEKLSYINTRDQE